MFHAAPIVKVEGEVYVLDPTIYYDKPLTVKDWALNLTPDFSNVNFSYCSGDTYKQNYDCESPEIVSEELVKKETDFFLMVEWNVLKYLGMDPYTLLF